MKKLFLLAILVSGGIYGWQHKDSLPTFFGFYNRPDFANYIQKPTKEYALRSLDRRMMTLNDLLVDGSHTLIYVTSDNCMSCKQVHKNVQTILNYRKDVAIRKLTVRDIHSPNIDKHQLRFEQSLLDKHGILEPPFVQLYNAQGELIATDRSESQTGERFIEFWAKKEVRRNS